MHTRMWIKLQTLPIKRVFGSNDRVLEFPRPSLTLQSRVRPVVVSLWCKICTMFKISVLSRWKARDGKNKEQALTSAYRYLDFKPIPVENARELVEKLHDEVSGILNINTQFECCWTLLSRPAPICTLCDWCLCLTDLAWISSNHFPR